MEYSNFPTSVNGKQCIGPCYAPGKIFTHPQTIKHYKNTKYPFCPIAGYYDNEKKNYKYIDECNPADVNEDQTYKTLSIAIPLITFDCKSFLKTYYNIHSFENTINWLETNKNPNYTQLRVLNCAWAVYGKTTDIIDDALVNFYIDLIKTIWIKNIYHKIAQYIYVDDKKIFFKENSDTEKNQVEKINFFIKKIITPQFVYDVLKTYIESNYDKWDTITDHNSNINSQLINMALDKIQNIITTI